MQAVVKTPRIEINIKGEIPDRLMSALKEEYGEQIQLLEDNDEEAVTSLRPTGIGISSQR